MLYFSITAKAETRVINSSGQNSNSTPAQDADNNSDQISNTPSQGADNNSDQNSSSAPGQNTGNPSTGDNSPSGNTQNAAGNGSSSSENTGATSESIEAKTVNTSQTKTPGTEITDNKGIYVITSAAEGSMTVELKAPVKKTYKSFTVNGTITDSDGTIYTVTSIAPNAFKGNKKLKTLTIAETVTKIGKGAFKNCKKLSKITIAGTNLSSIGKKAFNGAGNATKIIIKTADKDAYKKLVKLIKTSGAKKANYKMKK